MKDCEDCQGTGWTEEGWEKARKENDGKDNMGDWQFKGDCQPCEGTGQVKN